MAFVGGYHCSLIISFHSSLRDDVPVRFFFKQQLCSCLPFVFSFPIKHGSFLSSYLILLPTIYWTRNSFRLILTFLVPMPDWICIHDIGLHYQVIFFNNCGVFSTTLMQITGPSITKDLLFLLQLVTAFGFPYSDQYSSIYRIIWGFFPPNLLAVGLNLLADATSSPGDPGVSWSERTKCVANDDTDCLISIVCSESQLIIVFFIAFSCVFPYICV